jgi:hypothetical protein
MKIFKILVVLASSACMAQGHAESNFNYDYVEVGAVTLDTKILGVDVGGDTLGISGSFDLSESVNLLASHQSTDFNFGLEGTQSSVGVGYHDSTGRGMDLYLEIFYLEMELAFPDDELQDVDETGNGINIGVRNLIGDRFEIDFVFSHVDIGLGTNQTGFGIAGRYYFHRTFALSVSYSSAEDTRGSGLGLRVGF